MAKRSLGAGSGVKPRSIHGAAGVRLSIKQVPWSSHILDGKSHSHPSAYAESGDAALDPALSHFMEERHRNARSCAADGMSERNRTTVYVQSVAVEVEFTIAGQHLRGEGFVQFHQSKIGELESVLLFQLAQRRDWADAHDAGIDARGTDRQNAG